MKAILVAAGFGTRMLPVTKSVPKEMLPVGSKPVIQYTIDGLVKAGITDITFITSQQKKALEDYFDKNFELEETLKAKNKIDMLELINRPKNMAKYSFVKQLEIKGTAHAISLVEHLIQDDYFMVVFPDAIYHPEMFVQLMNAFHQNPAPFLCVHQVPMEETCKYGVLQLDGDKIQQIIEGPKVEEAPSDLVCNGVYILHKSIFPIIHNLPIDIKRGEYLLPDALNILMKQMSVYFQRVVPFFDIGTVDGFLKANAKLYTDGVLFD